MLEPRLASPGKALRDLMAKDTLLLPGVFSAISARSAMKAGAKALYLSGAGVTNSLLAVPDIGLLTLTEMADQAAKAVSASALPIIADADTGYGEVFNLARTVQEMERAGLAGIHLEDQVNPKKCGHLDGKALIEPSEMAKKLTAALAARSDQSFLIIARTDARGPEGLDRAIERAKLYADAGADAIFPEGLESESEFEAFRESLSVPLLANMTEFGKTPLIGYERFKELGYNLVIFPQTAFRMALKAMDVAYAHLLAKGTQEGLLDWMKTRVELYDLLDYPAYDQKDREWSERVEKG